MDPAPAPPEAKALPEIVRMSVYIANSILTNAPMTAAQMECAREYYRDLAGRLIQGGPRFHHARKDAIDMHNRVVSRIRGERERMAFELRRQAEESEGNVLLDIQP